MNLRRYRAKKKKSCSIINVVHLQCLVVTIIINYVLYIVKFLFSLI